MHYRGKIISPISLWSNYVDNLKDTGGEWSNLVFCPNPDHNNMRTPAFNINLKKPTVNCFGCDLQGSYEEAIMIIEACDRPHARKIILENARLPFEGEKHEFRKDEPKKEKFSDDDLANYSYLPPVCREYFDSRNITPQSRTRWQLGYDDKEKRITIPVFDRRDRLKFIIRRAIHDWQQPRYLYPAESSKTEILFGSINLDKKLVEEQGIILVEGSLDTIIMHQHGFKNTVGILGSSLSDSQKNELVRLRPKAIYICFDADYAGIHAMQTVASLRKHYPLYIVIYPRDKSDPADMTQEEAEFAIRNALPFSKFVAKLEKVGLADQFNATLSKIERKDTGKKKEEIIVYGK